MSSQKEKDLYPDIRIWLSNILKSYYPKHEVDSFDTSTVYLSNFIQSKDWISYRPDYVTYQLKIDILGAVLIKKVLEFIFIEVKNTQISLKDISQLLGYSRVAKPLHSFIISPKWVSDPVKILFENYKRYDILRFDESKFIKIAKWDQDKKDIDYNYIYPGSPLFESNR